MGKCISKNSYKKSSDINTEMIKNEDFKNAYSVEEIINETKFQIIYKAKNKISQQLRAIKCIPAKSDRSKKFLDEAKMLQNFDHQNIIKVFEIYQDSFHLSLVFEFCKGGKLIDRILRLGGFSENDVARHIKQISSALIYIHRKNIVHRDISPDNLLFLSDKIDSPIKIIDFASSKKLVSSWGEAKDIAFTAPEVITGRYTDKCDIWSLGIILYLMLSGETPFKGKNEVELLLDIQTRELSFKERIWKKTSPEAVSLIQQMLKKNPDERITAQEVYNNEWIQRYTNDSTESKLIKSESIKKLAIYHNTSNLYRATLEFIASQLVTSEEIANIKKMFQELDKNGDGVLSIDEIAHALEGPTINISNIQEIFQKTDRNGNGTIEYSEFLTALLDSEKALSKEKLMTMFKMFDKNGDGLISLDEIKEALDAKNRGDNYFVEMIKEADTSGDGYIDLEEFCNFISKNKNN